MLWCVPDVACKRTSDKFGRSKAAKIPSPKNRGEERQRVGWLQESELPVAPKDTETDRAAGLACFW